MGPRGSRLGCRLDQPAGRPSGTGGCVGEGLSLAGVARALERDMTQLNVRSFGGSVLHRNGSRLPPFPTRKAEGLFGLLLIHRDRPVHRDVLCGALWGDRTDCEARKALRTALWRIRSVVEPETNDRGSVIRVEGDHIGLTTTGEIKVDAWELEDSVKPHRGTRPGPLDEAGVRRIESAVSLYRGDFLESQYEDWCALHRERLRLVFLSGLARLHDHYRERGKWVFAIESARRLLRHDPLREDIHRSLMFCHQAMGDRPSALRQYAACRSILQEELDIDPMDETRELYNSIRKGKREQVVASGRRSWPPDAKEPLAEVDRALRELHALTERLERTRAALRSTPHRNERSRPHLESTG